MRPTEHHQRLSDWASDICWRYPAEEKTVIFSFTKELWGTYHPLATEIWSTLLLFLSKKRTQRPGNQISSIIPNLAGLGAFSTLVGTPAGRCDPWCLQATCVAMGTGTLTTMPSCGKVSQRPQLINMKIKMHLTEVVNNYFLEKWGQGSLAMKMDLQSQFPGRRYPSERASEWDRLISTKPSPISGGNTVTHKETLWNFVCSNLSHFKSS